MPITFSFEAYRRLRTHSNPSERPARQFGIVARAVGIAIEGVVFAGLGAASGAIGQSVLSARGWHNSNFTLLRTVQSSAVGTGVLALLPGSIAFALDRAGVDITLSPKTRYNFKLNCTGAITMTLGTIVPIIVAPIGTIGTLLGSTILNYLPSHDSSDVGYSAAAGATGAAILGSGILISLLPVALCIVGGVLLCHCAGVDTENIFRRCLGQPNELPSSEGTTIASIESVPHAPPASLQQIADIIDRLDRGELELNSQTVPRAPSPTLR